MNEIQRRVLRSAEAGIENGYIFTSGRLNADGETETVTTLAYVDEAAGVAADWEPRYGPICVWHRCAAGDEGARPHYIFDYVNDGGLNWTQLAVELYGLQEALRAGDFAYIFSVLADYCA